MEQKQKIKSLKLSTGDISKSTRVPETHEKEYMKNFLNTLSESEKKANSYTDWSDKRIGEACLALYKMHVAFDDSGIISALSGINIMSNEMSRMQMKRLNFNLVLNNMRSDGLDRSVSFSLKEVSGNTIEKNDDFDNITSDNSQSNNAIDTFYHNNLKDNLENIGKMMKSIYHQLPDNVPNNKKDPKGREALFFTAYALTAINESLVMNAEDSTINLEDLYKTNSTGEKVAVDGSYQMDIHVEKVNPILNENNKNKKKI